MGHEPKLRDWEMARIFLVLAILTLGFVMGLQSLILTPVTTGHSRGYMSSRPKPLSTELGRDEVAGVVRDKASVDVSLSSLEERPHLLFRAFLPKSKPMSSEKEDSRSPQVPPE